MKTIMMAAAVSLTLAPAAFAAVPVAANPASKAVATSQAKDGVVLAAGPNRAGTISIPRGKGFMPGKGFAG